jgi:glycosyltransferase involved in cell wall biosynthesis
MNPDDDQHLIVVPAYNEERSLTHTITRLRILPSNFDVVVVNDGSSDSTSDLAHQLASEWHGRLHVVDLPINGGIGVAVQTGYRFALSRGHYKYVVQYDADGQHDSDDIIALVGFAQKLDLDLCVGSRFCEGANLSYRSTVMRRVGIRFLSRLIGLLGGQTTSDPTSGFRCAGPRAWTRFAEQYPEDYPEPESLYWLLRNGLRVGEMPVRMHPRLHGVSSIGSWRAVYYMTKVTLAILVDLLRRKENATQ